MRLLRTFTLNSLFSGLEALGLPTLFCPLWAFLSLGSDARLPDLLERLTRSDASLTCCALRRGSSAPLRRSSGFARRGCAALLSEARSWSRTLTTLCRWWSCETLCWICPTGTGACRSSWLTS